MVININPNRISGSSTGKTGSRQRQLTDETGGNAYTVPTRSDVNYIPPPESLRTLISSALAALRQGVRWDRGTILNLLV